MKVSVENWKDVEKKIREIGIEKTIHNSADVLEAIVLKNGERFEFTIDVWKQLQGKGLFTVKIGKRIAL